MFKKLRKNEKGAELLEFVVCMPVFLLLVSFIFTQGQYLYASYITKWALFDGTRKAMALQGTAGAGEVKAKEVLNKIMLANSYEVTCSKGATDTTCKADVHVDYFFNILGMGREISETIVLPTETAPSAKAEVRE